MQPAYKRILLKLSGEVLAGKEGHGINFDTVSDVCKHVKKCSEMGVQIGLVVGGGNFWRGRSSGNMDRTRADHIGMLATVMNALALADTLEQLDVPVRVQTAIEMPRVAEPYIRNRAVRHLEKGRVVIFGCGTGNPFFSTDTAAALRAAEINADVIFKATNVDGVYDKDPNRFADAVKYDELTHTEVLAKGLKVMDSTAASLCRDNNIPILVFNLNDPENIIRAAAGKASVSLLDKVVVDYYGCPTPVQQMAAVSVSEGRNLVIQPWDVSTINAIEKAIQASDLGVNPMNDGKVIRLNFPPLTEEKRKLLAKEVGKYAEEAKVAVRSIRRDAMEKLKKLNKDKAITEDELHDGEDEVQKITDKYVKEIDDMAKKKEADIMEI